MFVLLLVVAMATGAVAAVGSCVANGRQGDCRTQAECGSGQWLSYLQTTDQGCRSYAANIRCCIGATTSSNNNNNNNNNPVAGSGQACTSPQGVSGTCQRTSVCTKTSYPSRTGARGCEDIPAADVQCCAAAGSGGGNPNVPSAPVSPQGACQLARPDASCSAFTGRTMTINVRFIDEVQRVHGHARATGVSVYITDSYRSPSAGYGAGMSRHKVGFAIDMNANGCNADCMCRVPTRVASVTNFLRRVMADPQLWWGGDPARPIAWRVGSCSRDSVHIQSRNYEAGSNYNSEQSCLAREWSAGRFRSFSCPQLATLNDEIDLANLDNFNAADGITAEGLDAGAQAGIAVGVIVAVALLVALVVFCIVRRRTHDDGIVMPNMYFKAEQNENVGGSENFGNSALVSTAPPATETYAGHASGSPTEYTCADCGKSYQFADDLVTHRELRHSP